MSVSGSSSHEKCDQGWSLFDVRITIVAVRAILAAGAGVFVYCDLYKIGAHDHHAKSVFTVLQTLRDRSIHRRLADLTAPNVEGPQLILKDERDASMGW